MENIDRLKARLERKKSVPKAIITPIPISNCVIGENLTGDILKYMFCATGEVNRILIDFIDKPAEGITVGVEVVDSLGSNYRTYIVTRKDMLIEPELSIDSGDKLTISIAPIGQTIVKEAWVAIQWTPKVKDTEVQKLLLENEE